MIGQLPCLCQAMETRLLHHSAATCHNSFLVRMRSSDLFTDAKICSWRAWGVLIGLQTLEFVLGTNWKLWLVRKLIRRTYYLILKIKFVIHSYYCLVLCLFWFLVRGEWSEILVGRLNNFQTVNSVREEFPTKKSCPQSIGQKHLCK